MEYHFHIVAFLLGLAKIVHAVGPTSIFINQVPEYALLSTCAEAKLSTIVRNMDFGCGDMRQTTSYSCFCTDSSSKYSSMIGAYVASACTQDPSQNTSAIEVFSKYCELGARLTTAESSSLSSSQTIAATLRSTTNSASPASTIASSTASSTSSSTPTSISAPPPAKDNTTAIAAGVAVPFGVLAIVGVGLLIWWRKKKQGQKTTPAELGVEHRVHEAEVKAVRYELKGGHDDLPIEIDSKMIPAELNRSPVEVDAAGARAFDDGGRRV